MCLLQALSYLCAFLSILGIHWGFTPKEWKPLKLLKKHPPLYTYTFFLLLLRGTVLSAGGVCLQFGAWLHVGLVGGLLPSQGLARLQRSSSCRRCGNDLLIFTRELCYEPENLETRRSQILRSQGLAPLEFNCFWNDWCWGWFEVIMQ